MTMDTDFGIFTFHYVLYIPRNILRKNKPRLSRADQASLFVEFSEAENKAAILPLLQKEG